MLKPSYSDGSHGCHRNHSLGSHKAFHLILVPGDVAHVFIQSHFHALLHGEGRGVSSPGLGVLSHQSTPDLLTTEGHYLDEADIAG